MKNETTLAIEVVKQAGKIILDLYEQQPNAQAKGNAYNLVTEADLRAKRYIIAKIQEHFPDHAISTVLCSNMSSSTRAYFFPSKYWSSHCSLLVR